MSDDKLVEALRGRFKSYQRDQRLHTHAEQVYWLNQWRLFAKDAIAALQAHAAESAQPRGTMTPRELVRRIERGETWKLADESAQTAFWQVRYTDPNGMEFYPWEGTYTQAQAERLVDAHRQQDRAAQMRPLYVGQPAQRKPVMAANPLSPTGAQQPIQSVLRALASQEGCDGAPWDQMVQAADRIDELEQPQPQVDVDVMRGLVERWQHRAKVTFGDRQDALLDCADELDAQLPK